MPSRFSLENGTRGYDIHHNATVYPVAGIQPCDVRPCDAAQLAARTVRALRRLWRRRLFRPDDLCRPVGDPFAVGLGDLRYVVEAMSDKSFSEQAAFLMADTLDLIKQVLVKHSAAVLEEMRDQIVKRNDRISELERQLAEAVKRSKLQHDEAVQLRAELEWDKQEKSNYSKILTALSMEEEGDPVQGVLDLIAREKELMDENDEIDRRIGRIVKDGL